MVQRHSSITPHSLFISLHLRECAGNVLDGSLKRQEAFVRDVLVPSLPGLADLQELAEPGACCLLTVTFQSLVKKQLALVAGVVCTMAEQCSRLGRSTVDNEILCHAQIGVMIPTQPVADLIPLPGI